MLCLQNPSRFQSSDGPILTRYTLIAAMICLLDLVVFSPEAAAEYKRLESTHERSEAVPVPFDITSDRNTNTNASDQPSHLLIVL